MELKKTLIYGAVVAALVVGTSFITARYAGANGVPGLVPVQGCATDANGNPINGSQQVEFRLYASSNASQGDALYTETRNVNFRGCVFSEMLHPTDLGIFENNPSLYLGVKIAGDAELSPRFEVGASPYAIQARHADKATNAENAALATTATRATAADNGAPVGSIMAFAGAQVPDGWLLCNGSIIDPVKEPKYAALRSAIGDTWGDGGDGTQPLFHLPDLGGRFLRGVDYSLVKRDPDSSIRTFANPGGATGNAAGSVQSDLIRSHSHSVSSHNWCDPNTWSGPPPRGGCGGPTADYWASEAFGGGETRPINAYVNYIIKY